jgi:hypothetical protein
LQKIRPHLFLLHNIFVPAVIISETALASQGSTFQECPLFVPGNVRGSGKLIGETGGGGP